MTQTILGEVYCSITLLNKYHLLQTWFHGDAGYAVCPKNEGNPDYCTSRSGVHKSRTNTFFQAAPNIRASSVCALLRFTHPSASYNLDVAARFVETFVRPWSRCYRANTQQYINACMITDL
jgi:hypothetical protein